MKQLTINQIFKKLPSDFFKRSTRDISLLSCSIFEEFWPIIKRKFGIDLSVRFRFVRNNQVDWYLSQREQFEFSKKAGEICRNIRCAKQLAKKLIEITDWFDNFLKQNKKLENLVKNNKQFFDNYREFFVYHLAVIWGGNYLANLSLKNKKEKKEINRILKILNSAFKYNELVAPKVEKYFKKFKINHLLYDEVNKNVKRNIKTKPKNRSLLFIKNKRIICSYNEAKQIKKFIEKGLKRNQKELKGLVASKGIFTGKVRKILDLNRLDKCRKGDVLVTTMTRPQFNKFIKQAGAIITDEGGMLCHASILAREFKIPCIVGTKIATKVLKDGDLVEVDANKGVVKKIKK